MAFLVRCRWAEINIADPELYWFSKSFASEVPVFLSNDVSEVFLREEYISVDLKIHSNK